VSLFFGDYVRVLTEWLLRDYIQYVGVRSFLQGRRRGSRGRRRSSAAVSRIRGRRRVRARGFPLQRPHGGNGRKDDSGVAGGLSALDAAGVPRQVKLNLVVHERR